MIITPDVDLPDQVLQQHAAILGKTGSGKTYTAKGIVEKLLEAGRRVCIIDPTGVWWGLASSRDGTAGRFPVAIFGGDHGHIPITEHAGGPLGELVAGSNLASVIDLRNMLTSQQRRFVARFFESLYQHNTRPLHLVVDEADEFGPQNIARGSSSDDNPVARCLGQFDRIARRGRTRGFRLLVITQRPAKLNKDILGQAATLVSMQLTLPHDRAAVKTWVVDQADPEAGKEVIGSLPRLRRGEGWVWSPDAEILTRTTFPEITTFDSSSTPDDEDLEGEAEAVTLADVDLSEVRQAMAAAIEQAEDSDVDRLRAKVKDLKEQLAKALRTPVSVPPEDVQQLRRDLENERELRIATEEDLAVCTRAIHDVREIIDRIRDSGSLGDDPVDRDTELVTLAPRRLRLARVPEAVKTAAANGESVKLPPRSSGTYTQRTRAAQPPRRPAGDEPSSELTGPERKILDALEHWYALDVTPSRQQIAIIAGYHARTKSFLNALGSLRSRGLIDSADQISPRPVRRQRPTREEHLRRIHSMLQPRETEILNVIHRHGRITRTQLAASFDMHERTKSLLNALGRLRTMGLIRYLSGGLVELTDTVTKGLQ